MTWKGLGEPVIGKLRGVIDAYGEDFVIIDVSGVGYVVHCSSRTLQHLPSVGEGATLAIETHCPRGHDPAQIEPSPERLRDSFTPNLAASPNCYPVTSKGPDLHA